MKEFRVILELDPKAGPRDSSVMKSVNADIPALAHKERRTLTEIYFTVSDCDHRRAGALTWMASNLDAFRTEFRRSAHAV